MIAQMVAVMIRLFVSLSFAYWKSLYIKTLAGWRVKFTYDESVAANRLFLPPRPPKALVFLDKGLGLSYSFYSGVLNSKTTLSSLSKVTVSMVFLFACSTEVFNKMAFLRSVGGLYPIFARQTALSRSGPYSSALLRYSGALTSSVTVLCSSVT